MVDGVLLLVDASEGPMPQTRFVLRKALEARLPVILVVNKVDRPDARIAAVVDEVYELFLDLDATDDQVEFPIVYANARAGWAALDRGRGGHRPEAAARPDGRADPGARPTTPRRPLQAHVTNLDADRPTSAAWRSAGCATGRSARARRSPGVAPTARSRRRPSPTSTSPRRSTASRPTRPGPGEIIAVGGIDEVTIGETLADPDDPRPLPVITVDEPSLSIVIGINNGPLAGQARARS